MIQNMSVPKIVTRGVMFERKSVRYLLKTDFLLQVFNNTGNT